MKSPYENAVENRLRRAKSPAELAAIAREQAGQVVETSGRAQTERTAKETAENRVTALENRLRLLIAAVDPFVARGQDAQPDFTQREMEQLTDATESANGIL